MCKKYISILLSFVFILVAVCPINAIDGIDDKSNQSESNESKYVDENGNKVYEQDDLDPDVGQPAEGYYDPNSSTGGCAEEGPVVSTPSVDENGNTVYEYGYVYPDAGQPAEPGEGPIVSMPTIEAIDVTPPVIDAKDIELKVGDEFKVLEGVTAYDKEDGDITSSIVVIENTVNTSTAGIYKVVYEVMDSNGNTVTKEIKVAVQQIKNGWIYENEKWYYYNQNGEMATGWLNLDGVWYYLRNNGEMATGWLNLDGVWYYLRNSGAMEKGWLNLNGTWYYLNSSGAMETGWLNLNGTWYYLNSSGAMETGWLNLNGTWYYLNSSGAMETGWLNLNGTWYYLDSSGAMKTGWLNLNGTWYYIYESGKMATNTTIDGWKIGSNGVATKIK